jgi:hypothetical protein
MLDAQMRTLFESQISKEANTNDLFNGPNSPLSSLSNKIELALAFGLISQLEYRNLTLIRRIRNEFAHKIGELSFDSSAISNRCTELEVPIGMRMPLFIDLSIILESDNDFSSLPPMPFDTPRERYITAVHAMSSSLFGRLIEMLGPRPEPRPPYKRNSEVNEILILKHMENKEDLIRQESDLNEHRERVADLQVRIDGCRKRLAKLSVGSKPSDEYKQLEKELAEMDKQVESSQSEVDRLQSGLDDILSSKAFQVADLVENRLFKEIISFTRRWEAWAESTEI